MRLHFDAAGELVTANGRLVPDVQLESVVPTVTAEMAASQAEVAVRKVLPDPDLAATATQLYVYRVGFLAGRVGTDHLAWHVDVTNGHDLREFVVIDAHTGRVIDQYTGIESLHRRVSHRTIGNVVWDEGDPYPFEGIDQNADVGVNNLIDFSEDSFQFFANVSGGTFLSYNGNDGVMRSVYDSSEINCPNAFWTSGGQYTAFCPGLVVDDVVAHEWTHAYTDYTHNLIYRWQPGALNEAYSDIFGEVVDELNGAGNDTPDMLRVDGECTDVAASTRPRLVIETPPEIEGEYEAGGAAFNPLPPYSITADVELVNDGSDNPTNGCDAFVDFTPGNIAIIEFGTACQFRIPADNAVAAGAAGVIYVNARNDTVVDIPGSGSPAPIPTLWIGLTDGQSIINQLDNGVVATLAAGGTSGSVRWIMAEDSSSLPGMRDMWHPNCAGDPGKVSDSQYHCSTSDNGGVHTNSGVPNHAFAMIVDGGNYNGYTINGIGMTKAAHIYWRAMSVYQTIGSDFLEHAEMIEQSCQDLTGQTITDLVTGGPSNEIITGDDCAQVAEAMLAVEMRMPPSRCNFDLVLEPGAPDRGRYQSELFVETFDSDPTPEWSLSNQGVAGEWVERNWEWTVDVPAGGDGGALFATDDDMGGNCVTNDQSGVLLLESPEIAIPDGQLPVLLFDHYAATEYRADGGNLKISVNGGPFQLVPDEAFLFNPYNRELYGSETSSNNPIAGEPAFTGYDEGTYYRGSWGQSQVDLTTVARPGDTIKLRFDFGVDGCTGIDGWYLDNVRILTADAVVRLGGGRALP
jgi:Zn-dependent metalloprotease